MKEINYGVGPLSTLSLYPSFSSFSPPPILCYTPQSSHDIKPCLDLANVCVCVGASLCVFLPAAKIQQLKWPLNFISKHKVHLKQQAGCGPTAVLPPFNSRTDWRVHMTRL